MASEQNTGTAQYLSGLVRTISSEAVEEEDRFRVRQHLLDSIAAGLIGSATPVYPDLVGAGLLGSSQAEPGLLDTAMLWAFAINGSVFEDGSKEGACHPAAAVMPVVLTFGGGKSWELIDRAVIAGYDVMVRLARGGNPQLTLKGFHPTAIFAPFGAAAALSVLQGYDQRRTANALCLAAQGGSGLMAAFKRGPVQPLQVAWSVRNGVCAALLAGQGHEGYPRIIEEGFYPAYLTQKPVAAVDAPLKHRSAIRGAYLKPYPGCRHLHPALDAFTAILERGALDGAQIRKIRVLTYRTAVETEIHELNCRGDAYFNLPYAMAARLVLGHCDYDAFDEMHFGDPRILDLMGHITVDTDPVIDALYPSRRAAYVEVHTREGALESEKVMIARGEPENPLPTDFTLQKLRKASRGFLGEAQPAEIETILDDDRPPDTSKVFAGLTRILTTTQGSKDAA